MQTVIYEVLEGLIRLLTPILLHTMEEAWKELPTKTSYVQLEDLPQIEDVSKERELISEWDVFFNIESGVAKALEEAKNWKDDPIKKSFEAHVVLYVDKETKDKLNELSDHLEQLLIVSSVEIKEYNEKSTDALDCDGYAVEVIKAEGDVCERCRAVRPEVGSIEGASNLCHRCHDIVQEHFPQYFEEQED